MTAIDYRFKTVVKFTTPLIEAAIRTRFEDLLVPLVNDKVNQRLGPHITGLIVTHILHLRPITVPEAGFEAFPKFHLSGDTSQDEAFINARIDQVYEDVKGLVEQDIIAQGGSVLSWHTHLTTGVVDEVG